MMEPRNKRIQTQTKQIVLVPARPPRPLRRLPARQLPARRLPRRRLSSLLAVPSLVLAILAVMTVLALATFNCAVLVIRSRAVPNQSQVVMLNQLPTLTPTINLAAVAVTGQEAALTPTPLPTFTPSPTPVQNQLAAASPSPVVQAAAPAAPTPRVWSTPTVPSLPAATPTSAPTPTPMPTIAAPTTTAAGDWSFIGTWANFAPRRKLVVLSGEMVNNTGFPQKLSLVTGTFYDERGQVIAADKSTYPTWPVNVVPPGGHLPFALTVYDIDGAANFELAVQSEPSDMALRQDFEFVAVSEQRNENQYCLAGTLKNPGGTLEKQLVIVVILYDEQGNVLRFVDDNKPAFKEVVGDRTMDFEICIKSPPDNVASHELLAWGL